MRGLLLIALRRVGNDRIGTPPGGRLEVGPAMRSRPGGTSSRRGAGRLRADGAEQPRQLELALRFDGRPGAGEHGAHHQMRVAVGRVVIGPTPAARQRARLTVAGQRGA